MKRKERRKKATGKNKEQGTRNKEARKYNLENGVNKVETFIGE